MKFRKKILLLFLSFALIMTLQKQASAQSDIYMRIQSQGFRPVLIEITPFLCRYPTDLHTRIRSVLSEDLENSSFFHVFETGEPGLKAGARVTGELTIEGPRITLKANLLDGSGKQTIFTQDYQSHLSDLRSIAHRLSDDIVTYLIGDYGVASTKITFVKRRGRQSVIKIMDYDGFNSRTLIETGSLNLSPAWYPNASALLLTSFSESNPDLALYTFKNNRLRRLNRRRGLHASPACSPDGEWVALAITEAGNTDLYLNDLKGRRVRRLTTTPAIDCAPSWSPDGRAIVFTSDRSGSPQVYLMDADGSNVRRLTYAGSYNDSPVWSPRGDLIAYVSRESGGFQIYTMDITGSNVKRLTDGTANNEDPSWSPDGLRVVYASDRDGAWNIYSCFWDGRNTQQLTRDGGNISPSWSPKLPK